MPGNGPAVIGRAGDREQGAAVELRFELQGNRIGGAGFTVFGCPHLLAAASWLTERAVGLTQPELEAWNWKPAAEALQVPITEAMSRDEIIRAVDEAMEARQ